MAAINTVLVECAKRSLATSYGPLAAPTVASDFQMTKRELLAIGLAELTTQHHAVICTLIIDDLHPSARALTRPCMEAAFRSVWISRFATDGEVLQVIKGGRNAWPKLERLIGTVGSRTMSRELRAFIPPTQWLNEMTHGGALSTVAALPHNGLDPHIIDLRDGMTISCLIAVEHILALARINILQRVGDDENALLTLEAFGESVVQTNNDAVPLLEKYGKATEHFRSIL